LAPARPLGPLQGSSSRDRRGPLVANVVRRHPGPVRHSMAATGRIGLGDRRRLFTGARDGRTDQARVPGAIEPSLVAPPSAVSGGNAAACRNESVGRRVEQAEPARCRSGWSACRCRVHAPLRRRRASQLRPVTCCSAGQRPALPLTAAGRQARPASASALTTNVDRVDDMPRGFLVGGS
jgi:hypothetical protein